MPVYEGYKSYSRSTLFRSDCLKNFMNILQGPFLFIINIINNFYTYTQLRTPMIFLSLRLSKKYFELLQEAFLCNINITKSSYRYTKLHVSNIFAYKRYKLQKRTNQTRNKEVVTERRSLIQSSTTCITAALLSQTKRILTAACIAINHTILHNQNHFVLVITPFPTERN